MSLVHYISRPRHSGALMHSLLPQQGTPPSRDGFASSPLTAPLVGVLASDGLSGGLAPADLYQQEPSSWNMTTTIT